MSKRVTKEQLVDLLISFIDLYDDGQVLINCTEAEDLIEQVRVALDIPTSHYDINISLLIPVIEGMTNEEIDNPKQYEITIRNKKTKEELYIENIDIQQK